MTCLSEHTVDSLAAKLALHGLHPSAASRLLRAFWKDEAFDLDAIGIAKLTRAFIREQFASSQCRISHRHDSADGTIKLLIELLAGGTVECVLMPSHRLDRAAACVSSQVGCAMGCDFCASTKAGLMRNLLAGEIVEQFKFLRAIAQQQGRRIASLVFMGMGEPLANLENVAQSIRILSTRGLGDLGKRAITVSTVGLVPGIEALSELDLGVNLALSLHAPDDETRGRLVPANRKWKVADIMGAVKRFQDRHGRPVNIEYCLLAGVNDSTVQAELLAELMCGFRAHVNIIPYNAIGSGISGVIYRRPTAESIANFVQILRDRGVVAHVRQTRGDDVAAACGQLRQVPSAECRVPNKKDAGLSPLHSALGTRHSALP